ncbi:hypothetical protein [Nonomuraea sp. NPDC049309]|uniref:hypothetical protein n=1 Tax=Nonomuraea sp. NPDC049309 TaxID=3364350 RepID=UPI003715B2AB
MFEIVSALLPPLVVGTAFVIGVVKLARSEGRAKAAEAREHRPVPVTPGSPSADEQDEKPPASPGS